MCDLFVFSIFVKYETTAHIISLRFNIVEVSNSDAFLDGNIDRAEGNASKLTIQALDIGRHKSVPYILKGKQYKAVQVDDKIYVPNKNI